MNDVFMILSQKFGLETVIKAVIVCVIMMVIKKFKPKLSPKTELVIRLAISFLVHLLLTFIVGGEYALLFEGAISVCGVSMIFCALTSKKCDKELLKEEISCFLPDFKEEEIEQVLQEQIKIEDISPVIIDKSGGENQSIAD